MKLNNEDPARQLFCAVLNRALDDACSPKEHTHTAACDWIFSDATHELSFRWYAEALDYDWDFVFEFRMRVLPYVL
jgi:hypothetical protein